MAKAKPEPARREMIPSSIDRLLDRFPFDRVAAVMELLDWKWGTGDARHKPTIAEMRSTARQLLENVQKDNVIESGMGGFVATYYVDEGIQPTLQLRFEICCEEMA
jgi:hypothetical protein